jgi:phosphoserine phosphatase RsbU/P
MDATTLPLYRDQLLDRRQKLQQVAATATDIERLLAEVDAALMRITIGTYGLCDTCGDPIEADRLLADPLTRMCLDHLTPHEQRALEQDLDLAARIQRELLPKPDTPLDGWEFAYHYQPAGAVSGDYCDLIPSTESGTEAGGAGVYFLLGDVAGKGVAAAMLMSHLSATLRALVSVGLPLDSLMARASRMFCESTLPSHYATLVCCRTDGNGNIDISNAGHPPALVIQSAGVAYVESTALPIGMFCSGGFPSTRVQLAPGDALLLYSDGLVEAENAAGDEYGVQRLSELAASTAGMAPAAIVNTCVADLTAFAATRRQRDDVTIMAIRRK